MKAVVLGVNEPKGRKPHQARQRGCGLSKFIKALSLDLGIRPRYHDLREWVQRGILVLSLKEPDATAKVHWLANNKKDIPYVLYSKPSKYYYPYLHNAGCTNIRYKPPYFRRSDPVDWSIR